MKYFSLNILFLFFIAIVVSGCSSKALKSDVGLGYTDLECSQKKVDYTKDFFLVRINYIPVNCYEYFDDFSEQIEAVLFENGFQKKSFPDYVPVVGEQLFLYIFFKDNEIFFKSYKNVNDGPMIEAASGKIKNSDELIAAFAIN